tara:strand:+ start:1003 stop:1449 length:447 start_codon:yes stop_codon:yes gene_type:complete
MIHLKQLPFIYILILFSFFSFSQNSIEDAMKGKVAGLTIFSQSGDPGSPSYIRIRGNGSIMGNNAPLFVVDGIPYENYTIGANPRFPGFDMLSFINTLDVESIHVLKNAKDVAPYGVKGSNGVIVVTTKKGTRGATLKDVLIEMDLVK